METAGEMKLKTLKEIEIVEQEKEQERMYKHSVAQEAVSSSTRSYPPFLEG